MRPKFAATKIFSRETTFEHSAQSFRPRFKSQPQPEQIRGTLGPFALSASVELPWTCRRRLCVRRVAGTVCCRGFRKVDHSLRDNHSATGATALPHVAEVSESLSANEPISRQL